MNDANDRRPPSFERSQQLAERAKPRVAGFTQSMMKRPDQFAPGRFPVYLEGGEGAVVRDVDGNTYIDYICGLGANSLGHRHPAVLKAVERGLSRGIIHSLPDPVEVETAEAICGLIPGAEMVRFFKTGADANSAAVRLARHVTGRNHIFTVGYNGWHDQFMFDTPGVPEAVAAHTTRLSLLAPPEEEVLLTKIRECGSELAAVLLSLPYNRVVEASFMLKLRQACSEVGALLVMDEIVTGFRLHLGGAQARFGVQADLATFSKSLAAGMPLSAVTGTASLMQRMEELQVSTTFGGEILSLEVCRSALAVYAEGGYIEHVGAVGRRLRAGVNRVAEDLGSPLRVLGYDPIPMFLFARDREQHVRLAERFVGEMAKRGVLLRRDVNFIGGAHTEEQVGVTVEACRDALKAMAG